MGNLKDILYRKMNARGILHNEHNQRVIDLVVDVITNPCECRCCICYTEPDNIYGGFVEKKQCLDCGEIYISGYVKERG